MSTVLFRYIVFFPCFWFLYFTSFQCLFSFMGLFIALITCFLVPLFVLPFYFFSFCECEYVSLCFCPFSFTIRFRVLCVHSLFVCLILFFLSFFYFFLSLSSLCCVESWCSNQGPGLKPPR